MDRATPTPSQSKIRRETELNDKTAERWVQHLKEVLKQPKPNGEPAGTGPLDDLNINSDHPLRLKWKLQLTIFRRNSFT